MNRRLIVRIATALLAVAMLAVPASAVAGKNKNKSKTLTVCEHGCKYNKIQKAVKKAGKDSKVETIKVKPGKYVEGVVVDGSDFNGLTITGTGKTPKKTILEGKNAQLPGGLGIANNGIEIDDAKNVTIENMWVRNFATNGVFWRDTNTADDKNTCKNPVGTNMAVSFNRSYGLFTFGCVGGEFSKSEGWGQGDSPYYVGATPFQEDPVQTVLNKLDAHENVLGYSGTNSKYMVIKNSNFYNNGIGVVPNTLDSEPFEPTGDSVLKDNNIFWNNFNYFLPNSRVQTVSNGLGELGDSVLQYPTGLGVALFGADGWTVKDNAIFGNFKWGVAMFSDPFNDGGDAMSQNNQVLNNEMGRNGTDTNQFDFWVDGSGTGNCFQGNTSSTFSPTSNDSVPVGLLYPDCSFPDAQPNAGASGTSDGAAAQVGELLSYVLSSKPPDNSNPAENQQCSWLEHSHPAFKDYEPLEVTPGPDCP